MSKEVKGRAYGFLDTPIGMQKLNELLGEYSVSLGVDLHIKELRDANSANPYISKLMENLRLEGMNKFIELRSYQGDNKEAYETLIQILFDAPILTTGSKRSIIICGLDNDLTLKFL
ncbi:Uncharacterised protein [uncultured archaeon]|nr:Uncharacterised protein [uncultured archaeon]